MRRNFDSLSFLFVIIGALFFVFSCTNPLMETLKIRDEAFSKPTAIIDSPSGNSLGMNTSICITFSENMDRSSLQLGGEIASCVGELLWSSNGDSGETLEIKPMLAWPCGSNKTFSLVCSDLDGYPIESINLQYGVLDNIVFVHADNGNDSFAGTSDQPILSLQKAIDIAEELFNKGEIHVSAGSYHIAEPIYVNSDNSILGGYAPSDWTSRDSSLYVSEIQPVVLTSVWATISFENSVTRECEISGFVFMSPGENVSDSAVSVWIDNSSPMVSNNCFQLGSETKGVSHVEYAIYIDGGDPYIIDNTIEPGTGEQTCCIGIVGANGIIESNEFLYGYADAYTGVYLDNSTTTLIGNRIDGASTSQEALALDIYGGGLAIVRNNILIAGETTADDPSMDSIGILVRDGANIIAQNNIISGGLASSIGGADFATAIMLWNSGDFVQIDNNILFTDGDNTTEYRFGVWVYGDSEGPITFRNNLFFQCQESEYVDSVRSVNFADDIEGLETFLSIRGVEAGGNLCNVEPMLDSSDYSFTISSPLTITSGGTDLSNEWSDAKDILYQNRTLDWSLGAYEKD